MHYCQRCEEPRAMEPAGRQEARCAECGSRSDGAARAPLLVVTGASCSGKTAILAPLAVALAAHCITFDADVLLDAAGALSRGLPIDWPAFHAALLAVAHGVAQSGRPTVLLAPLRPGSLESLPARRWIGDIRYLVLDCPDDVRRERMAARPPWRLHDVEEQVSWGRWLRANVPDRVDTSQGTPADSAAAVASWVLGHLRPAASFRADLPARRGSVRGMTLDVATATAAKLTRAIRDRQLSSRELLEELLTRADRVNPALNAIVAWDVERARVAASAADDAIGRGESAGPLHGLPMTVKDVWETEGLVTTSGATELARHMPATDALGVARLRQAGAIIFGKTNTPEYAGDWQTYNEVYGRTSNPWDISRTAGGSSGGAAAAVAAGLTPLEFGSDIGGSIRVPSHCNGVYGLKPSWGLVPVRGHIPGPPGSLLTVDVGVAGPIARCVADLRTAFGVLAGPLPEDAPGWRLDLDPGPELSDVAGLRVAVALADGGDMVPIASDVRGQLGGFAGRLDAAGAEVEEVRLPVPLADGLATWRDVTMPILGAGLPDATFARFAALENVPGDDPMQAAERAMASRFRDVLTATNLRQRQRAAWAEFFRRYDVVLAPVLPVAAFPHDTDRPVSERLLDVDGVAVPHPLAAAWVCAIGVMLLPVVTLPVGLTESGLPVGVQVVGPFLSDLRLLRIAELLDAAAGPGFIAPPVG